MEHAVQSLKIGGDCSQVEPTVESLLEAAIKLIDIHNMKLVINGIQFDIGTDSKMVSKALEIYACDCIMRTCTEKNIRCVVNPCQNSYPDCIVYDKEVPVAVDIKTSYLINTEKINGFTLGTYRGYFRNRDGNKNVMIPYEKFYKHYCICIIYARTETGVTVKHAMLREKWQLASKRTGSGNTTNIGSTTRLQDIIERNSVFQSEEEFNNYWIKYQT